MARCRYVNDIAYRQLSDLLTNMLTDLQLALNPIPPHTTSIYLNECHTVTLHIPIISRITAQCDVKSSQHAAIRFNVCWCSCRSYRNKSKFDPAFYVSGGRNSSVGIATRYGLDGPGIESRWGRDVSPTSRPALGPNHAPTQWVPSLSRG
jgi:hypothetical protein